jgi:hypothetical protein
MPGSEYFTVGGPLKLKGSGVEKKKKKKKHKLKDKAIVGSEDDVDSNLKEELRREDSEEDKFMDAIKTPTDDTDDLNINQKEAIAGFSDFKAHGGKTEAEIKFAERRHQRVSLSVTLLLSFKTNTT